ncbi:MAG: HAD family phosphatase [Clostridia bacterium]|nr:HAD family phosphatase [Clostridia bacterium]
MAPRNIKLIAFDLDGTLTQHKSPLEPSARRLLDELSAKYKLLMVGAGACRRIFNQMESYPIDIIGNYGLQCAVYDAEKRDIVITAEHTKPCDRESVTARVEQLRQKYGMTKYWGDSVEFHASGAVTIPCIGTKAPIDEKLAYDPDRSKRRAIYEEVKALFPEYTVFVGGSSSFDMVPAPYDKYYALDSYCRENGLKHENVLYVGDDYGNGGNDEAVFESDFPAVAIDDYRTTPEILKFLL